MANLLDEKFQAKVLIVEDDPTTSFMQAETLKKMGFVVELVQNGADALRVLKSFKPHVVILDLLLPEKTGLQVIQEMFLDKELKEIEVIAWSANMENNSNLGVAYYTHYTRVKGREPIMVNKVPMGDGRHMTIPEALAIALTNKFGGIPPALDQWIKIHRVNP